jgi:L-rhamnose mutarotase
MSDLYDIVIPVGPSDSDQINDQLNFTTKNIIGYRNIYLICYDTSIQIIDKSIIIIDEKTFPFTIKDVEKYHSKYDRNGWYLQQLLKLYAGLVIPGILERYLVIDADTYFLKPTIFVEDNKCLYNTGSEYHIPYFQHMLKLYPSMEKQIQESGICHHMIFEKNYINQLFAMVEEYNNTNNNSDNYQYFWQIFLEKVNPEHYGMTYINMSGASEYELYFNYMLKYNKEKITVRKLEWANVSNDPNNYTLSKYNYVSWHSYMRR